MEERLYKIIRIDEDDYGCEARPDEAVIGYDGTLFPPGMHCNNALDEELENLDSSNAQGEWLNNYMDAVAEMDGEYAQS